MRLALEMDIKDGQIMRGQVKPNSGSPCREWSITRFTERNRLGTYTACLSETTNLPMYVLAMNENFNMSFQWNPAVEIEAPDMNSRGAAPKWE